MERVTIVRTTGEEPLVFNGTLLWLHPWTEYGPRGDWVETKLFRTEDDQYVLWLASRSNSGSQEDERHMAWLLPDTDAVLEKLENEHPRAEEVTLSIADRLNAYEDLGKITEGKEKPIIALRSGKRPLRFHGWEIATYDDDDYQIGLYQTMGDPRVLALGYKGEEGTWYDAWVFHYLWEALEKLEREAPEIVAIIPTTGDEPLMFRGTLLWWDPRTEYGYRNDWVETKLFRNEDRQYVLWLAFRSDFGSPEDHWHMAWVLPDADAVLKKLGNEHPRAEEVTLSIADQLNAYEDLGQITKEKKAIVVLRIGKRPLRFHGWEVASYDDYPYEVRIYETVDGQYVLAWGYNVPYATEEERSRYDAWVLGSLEEALEALKRKSPGVAEEISRQLE